jgi:hypothetical protein
MPRFGPAIAAIAVILSASAPALAEMRLAVGAAAPIEQPVNGEIRPVYVTPVLGSRWEPTDNGFREPIYTTPRGYIYRHVRGYTFLPHVVRVKKRVAVKASNVTVKKRRPACVTDIGYGRYEHCS